MKGEQTGRFSFLECYNDSDISHTLLNYVEKWTAEKGKNKIIGPFAFTDKDPRGYQLSGVDVLGVIAAPNNSQYLASLIEKEGYYKEENLVEYIAPIPSNFTEIFLKVQERIESNKSMRAEYERINGKVAKTFRIYQKKL